MFERQFLEMSTQTITVAQLSTVSAYGAPTFSTSVSTYRAYIEPGTRVVLNQQGVQEVASATVFVFSSSAAIGPQSQVTLPDGRIPKMLRVDTVNDNRGQHHIEVAIG